MPSITLSADVAALRRRLQLPLRVEAARVQLAVLQAAVEEQQAVLATLLCEQNAVEQAGCKVQAVKASKPAYTSRLTAVLAAEQAALDACRTADAVNGRS